MSLSANYTNLQGCPKLANRSQPLVARSSPYYEDMWRRHRRLTSFFSDCRYMPQLQRYSPTKLCHGAKMAIFLRPVFSESSVQRVSDMHSKFALRPHRVWKYGTDIQSASAELKRGKKNRRTRMWANAQRDGRPAEQRWRPLFNAAKFC